jgi:hypothetical protein
VNCPQLGAVWLGACCLAACVAPRVVDEGHPDGGSVGTSSTAEAQIWSIVADWQLQELRLWMSWNPPYVVLEPETRAAPPASDALREDPGIQVSTLAAYERVRELSMPVDLASLRTRVPVVRDVAGPTWEELLAVHPEAKGVLGVSRVGFSDVGDQALVWFSAERLHSPSGAQRTFAVFDRTVEGWEMRFLSRMPRLPADPRRGAGLP